MASIWAQYQTIRWEKNGTGPEAYDCKGFVRMVQEEHFGLVLPDIIIPEWDNLRGLIGLMHDVPGAHGWHPVEDQQHGDLVVVRRPLHVGVWIAEPSGAGVLHCVEGSGVVFTRGAAWRLSGFGRKHHLRHESKLGGV